MTRRIRPWVACVWLASAGATQELVPVRHVIPFTLTADKIISVPAVLNGTEAVDLMLHTAVDSVSLTKAAVERLESLTFDESATIASWGGRQAARYSRGNTLAIGELAWSDVSITEDEHSGRLTDGKFGCNLFAGSVLEVDYDEAELRLYDELPNTQGYAKLATHAERGSLFLEGVLALGEVELTNRFLVHSGFNGSLLLDDEFVRQHDLSRRLETLGERELLDSLGNVLKTSRVVVPSLRFGSIEIENLQAEIFTGAIGKQKMSVVGAHVLQRFDLLLDAEREFLYLRERPRPQAQPL